MGGLHASLSRLTSVGVAWYVSSTNGSDAASPRGRDRTRPLATIAQAYTNATNGDWIVMLANHNENIGAALTCTKHAITFVGEGQGSSRPRLTRTANVALFNFTTATLNRFENIYFPQSTVAAATNRIVFNNAGHQIADCYFESGANDTGSVVQFTTGVDHVTIEDTYFVSTATSVSAQPGYAIDVVNAPNALRMNRVTFDGGTTGWSQQAAFLVTGSISNLRATNIDLLNDSDMLLTTGSSGYIAVRNTTGSARITWP